MALRDLAALAPLFARSAAAQKSAPVSFGTSNIFSTGILRDFFSGKGFGFVTPDEGDEDVFVHVKDNPHLLGCQKGELVTYVQERDERKGKFKGTNLVGC